jgi:hypothetical protein
MSNKPNLPQPAKQKANTVILCKRCEIYKKAKNALSINPSPKTNMRTMSIYGTVLLGVIYAISELTGLPAVIDAVLRSSIGFWLAFCIFKFRQHI